MKHNIKKLTLALSVCLPIYAFSEMEEADQISAPKITAAETIESSEQTESQISEETLQREARDTQLFIDITRTIQSIEAKFEQYSINDYRRTLESYSGIFKVKKPGKLAWLIQKPYEQYIISNGKKVWDYDVGFDEVNIKKVDAQSSQLIDILQSDRVELLVSDYAITANRYADETVFTFVPKLDNSEISQVTISFIDNVLNSIRLQTELGQSTIFDFLEVQINTEIKNSEFELAIPDGVDVYDSTLFN